MELKSKLQAISSNAHPTSFRHTAPRGILGVGMPMYDWSERLNRAFKATGWSKRELARKSGVNYDVINKCLRGEVENPRGKVIPDLAKALGVSEVWLKTGVQPPANNPQAPQPVSPQNVGDGLLPALPGRVSDLPFIGKKDLPVLGHAKGGEDAFFIEGSTSLVRTYRPHLLEDVPDAYAVEMWDTSMEPALRHGWMLWVHPHKPVRAEDAAVIQLRDGQALVKEYVRKNGREWVFKQYNPPKEVKFAREKVRSVHLIVGNSRGML